MLDKNVHTQSSLFRKHPVRVELRSWSEEERTDKYLGPAWPELTCAAESHPVYVTRRAGVWNQPDISIHLHKSIICHWPPVIIHYPHPRYKADMHLPYQFMLISFESYYITGGQTHWQAEIWWLIAEYWPMRGQDSSTSNQSEMETTSESYTQTLPVFPYTLQSPQYLWRAESYQYSQAWLLIRSTDIIWKL